MRSPTRNILTVLIAVVTVFSLGEASGPGKGAQPSLKKINDRKQLDVNSINATMNSNGVFVDQTVSYSSGLEWPKTSGKTAVYAAGVWIAGIHRPSGLIRTANMDQNAEYQPGPLLETFNTTTNDDGQPVSRANDARYRLYKIDRKDIASPSGNPDYVEWPGDLGAPYTDVNGNGWWDAGIDLPKFYGDQQIWCVSNDVNRGRHNNAGTTPPMGLELRCLYYAFNQAGPLGNVMFLRWQIINRSDADYDSTYISIWSDVDLGDAIDDLPGCDTTLSLGYVYNGDNNDGTAHGYGSAPPADGFDFLVGPRVPGGPADSAWVNGSWVKGFRNLPMTSYVVYANQTISWVLDPPLGTTNYPAIAYDYQKGKAGTVHQYLVSPTSGQPMMKWFSGDPVTGTGDLPGNFPLGTFAPQDIRIMMSSGPFTLAKGDTQEVVGAFIIAQGADRLASVTLLKQYAAMARPAFFLGAPVVSIEPLAPIQPTHTMLGLFGSATATVGDVKRSVWILAAKPAGSIAAIADTSALVTSITPDLPGVYKIQLIGEALSGLLDTAEVQFEAVENRRPVVDFSVPSGIVLGDTIHIDGSAINDPDGDPLTVRWKVDGGSFYPYTILSYADSSMGKIADSTAVSTTFYPYRTSRFTVTATVSDAYFTVQSSRDVVVDPIMTPNFQLHARYQVIGQPWSGGYYYLGPMKEFAGQIWFADYGSVFTPNFADFSSPGQAFQMYPGNFWVDGNRIFVAAGANGVWQYVTDEYRSVIGFGMVKPLTPQTSKDTTVVDVYFRSPVLFFSYGVAGIWAYDVTDLGSPSKLGEYSDNDYWGNFVIDGNLLYGLHPRTNRILVLDITSPGSISLKKTISLGAGYTRVKKFGSSLCVISPDTVSVYDISDTANVFRVVGIPVPTTHLPKNRFYDVSIHGTSLLAGTHEGSYIYDMTSPSLPVMLGKFITGFPQISTFLNASHLLTAQWDLYNPGYAERLEGLLEFDTPLTGVEQFRPAVPAAYALEQNYPNPFNPSTTIGYGLPQKSRVTLAIFNILGQQVALLVNGDNDAGYHQVRFDASGLASGVYFYRLQAGTYVETKKFLLLR